MTRTDARTRTDAPTAWRTRVAATVVTAVTAAATATVVAAPAHASTVTPPNGCAMPRSSVWESRMGAIAPHPRVIFGAADAATVEKAAADPVTATYHKRYIGWANTASTQPTPTYTTGRKATIGSASIGRITSLGYGLTATGDPLYSDRIRQEVAAILSFPEWGNDSFLDTAELSIAVALGYSLTSRQMTSAERADVRANLVSKALRAASCLWSTRDRMVAATDNWGVVSNAGMAMAALVVADSDPVLAAAALERSLHFANHAVAELGDGGTGEGTGYHHYLGYHLAWLEASMDRAFGSTGAAAVRAVPAYSSWTHHLTGPSGMYANFGDAEANRPSPLLAAWNGLRAGDALGAWQADQLLRADKAGPLFLLWRRGTGTAPPAGVQAAVFPTSGFAAMRSGDTPTSTWLAVKGGSNTPSHSQLQLGSFVLEMLGQRFVSAYGMDNYSLPGYFVPATRATYFRNSTAGASTLARAGVNQRWTDTAPLSAVQRRADGGVQVSVDLAAALKVGRARRTAVVQKDGGVRLVDVVSATAPMTLRWRLHTQAGVAVDSGGRRAVLTRGGRSVAVTLDASTPGKLVALAPPATSGGRSNAGFTILQLDSPTATSRTATRTVSVRITAVS